MGQCMCPSRLFSLYLTVLQVYNRVFIRWTTHDIGGISEKDLDMAEACHEHATNLGGVVMENIDGTKLENDRATLMHLAAWQEDFVPSGPGFGSNP
ncbi:hypothetical protein F4801DRAFT_560095 [Xylaria longipes]|nr:hypothetical protein F4801DRAFT_560095 [Xylaria longipes]